MTTWKAGGMWAVVDVAGRQHDAGDSGNLYIWFFDDDLKSGVIRRWVPDTRFAGEKVSRIVP